jgi:hypothetical protein
MNSRVIAIVLGAVAAVLLFFNGVSIVLLWRQRNEISSLRFELEATAAEAERLRGTQVRSTPDRVPPASRPKVAPVQKDARGYTAQQLAEAEQRRTFLQNHFAQFPVLSFQPATNGEAAIQQFRINQYIVGKIKLERYTAFRFTVPEWIDGDFEWMFLYLTKADTDPRQRVYWGIVPEQGDMENFRSYELKALSEFSNLKERFPNSSEVFIQPLSRKSLVPGQTYAIWFSYSDVKVPEVALAMTVNSERGHKEFGILPTR